jgi:hypothetical protein
MVFFVRLVDTNKRHSDNVGDSMGSDFLFARASYLSGVARLLDFGATFTDYNHSPTPEEADRRAIRADWRAVGVDLQETMASAPCGNEGRSETGDPGDVKKDKASE